MHVCKGGAEALDLLTGMTAVHGLLEAGASSSSQDAAGATALTWAIERGRKDVLEIIAKYEYEPNTSRGFVIVAGTHTHTHTHGHRLRVRRPPISDAPTRMRVWLCDAHSACLCDAGTVRRRS